MITFFAQGLPKGQPRPRAFAMKIGNKFQARVFDSGTAENWKSRIAEAARPHLRKRSEWTCPACNAVTSFEDKECFTYICEDCENPLVLRESNLPNPLAKPIRLAIRFQMPRPKHHSNKKGLKPDAPFWHVGKPDADNLAKAVMDALTTLGMWKGDEQVAQLIVSKVYDDAIGALVEIHELEAVKQKQESEMELAL